MAERLDTYRHELSLRILVLLNDNVQKSTTEQRQGLRLLGRKGDDIVEAISINRKLTADRADQNQLYHEETQRQLDRVAAAIFTDRDGKTTTFSPLPNSGKSGIPQHPGATVGGLPHNLVTIHESNRPNRPGVASDVLMHDFGLVQRRVLDALFFRQIRDREDNVAPAHQTTLEWVFKDPKPLHKPWANFVQWLESGTGCYWLNGKAGSGKSTLMKHIYNDSRTRKALLLWAGNQSLSVASFFFYNLGSTLQKSQVGLLRSLLHDILKQNPELLPSLVPTLCVAASKGEDLEPSYMELKKGFENLVQISSSTSRKICLLIDGIDEFEGDHFTISNLFASIATSLNIKILVSSRPISACVDVFADSPSLRLQDLTYDDIRRYTNDIVGANKRWCEMVIEEDLHATQLVDEIAEKASGVFLWVVLVVASLLDGLRNYDRMTDLRRRLEALPADLENLYRHMLGKLEPLYQRQASQLLQIMYQQVDVEPGIPLSTLQLSFADEEDLGYAIACKIESLSSSKMISRCRATQARVRSRCCGLVEILHPWQFSEERRMIMSQVTFLHRTVVEFLRNSDVWSDLTNFTRPSAFDPNVALASCFLLDIKTLSDPNTVPFYFTGIRSRMKRCLNFCRFAERTTSQSHMRLVDELDRVMTVHWNSIRMLPLGSESTSYVTTKCKREWDYNESYTWTHVELSETAGIYHETEFTEAPYDMSVLAATAGLAVYYKEKCVREGSVADYLQIQQALMSAVYCAFNTPFNGFHLADVIRSREDYVEAIRHLLDMGANPNQRASERTLSSWEIVLWGMDKLIVDYEDMFILAIEEIYVGIEIIKIFLDHGADLDAHTQLKVEDEVHSPIHPLYIASEPVSKPTVSASSVIYRLRNCFSFRNDELKVDVSGLELLLSKRERDEQQNQRRQTPKPALTSSIETSSSFRAASNGTVPDGDDEKKTWRFSIFEKISSRGFGSLFKMRKSG